MGLEVCGAGGGGEEPTEPFTYGDDPTLDALWDDCEAGDADACDELWSSAPADSEYEQFGYSCGGIVPEGESEVCSEILDAGGSGDIPATGDPIIDSMLEACLAGNGVACDQAYALTEPGSEAETFADTCGGTADAGTFCSPELGGAKVIEPEVVDRASPTATTPSWTPGRTGAPTVTWASATCCSSSRRSTASTNGSAEPVATSSPRRTLPTRAWPGNDARLTSCRGIAGRSPEPDVCVRLPA